MHPKHRRSFLKSAGTMLTGAFGLPKLAMALQDAASPYQRPKVKILGQGEAPKHTNNGRVDLTFTGARWSGPRAFEEAGCHVSARSERFLS